MQSYYSYDDFNFRYKKLNPNDLRSRIMSLLLEQYCKGVRVKDISSLTIPDNIKAKSINQDNTESNDTQKGIEVVIILCSDLSTTHLILQWILLYNRNLYFSSRLPHDYLITLLLC